MREYLFGKRLSLFDGLVLGNLSIALGADIISFWTYLLGLLCGTVISTAIGENL